MTVNHACGKMIGIYCSVIVPLHKTAAQDILSLHTLSPRTQQIADYWLSLWDGDTLPMRAAINPAAIKALLPQIIFFWVTPHRAVRVGLAGITFQVMCGKEISGCDWLALTPREGRAMRLSIFSCVAHGAIGFNIWRFPQIDDKIRDCEKLLLPLHAETGTDIPVLGFVDWPRRAIAACRTSTSARFHRPLFLTPLLPYWKAADMPTLPSRFFPDKAVTA